MHHIRGKRRDSVLVASDELSRSFASRASFLRAASFLRELPVKADVGRL